MSADRPEQRREPRHRVRLAAKLLRGKKEPLALLTEDVSFRGLFVRTDTPPTLRQLVKIEIALLPDDRAVLLHGMVVHVIKPDAAGGRTPGAGVELMTLDAETKASWEAFVRHVQPRREESLRRIESAAIAHAPDPVRRRFQRHKAELRLISESAADLSTLVTTDISQGGMFVATDLPLPIGHELRVMVVHPESDATFALDCVVRRRDREASPPGVGVEFVKMDAARRVAFAAFIKDDEGAIDIGDHEIESEELEFLESEEPTTERAKIPK